MTDFQVFAVLALTGVIALLSVCVVFLAVTAYALCIAVVARPDVDESMKALPRLYLKVSSRVMGAPPSAAPALVKISTAVLVVMAIVFWSSRLAG